MKKYIVSLAIATFTLSSLTGCIEEYEPEGYGNYVTTDQASQAPGAFDNFVNNITSSLSGQFTYSGSDMRPWDFGYTSFFLQRDVMGQDIALANDGSWYQSWYASSIALGPRYAACQLPWTYYYGWIKNCNTVLSLGGENPDEKFKAGEGIAYAMRAMFYMDLARMYAPETYGKNKEALTVPLITEKGTEDMYNNPRLTNEKMFEFILSDLDKAEEYLAGYKRENKYTPDLSVVYGLKARAYLTMEDWANAEKYAKLAQQGYTEMTGEEYTSKTTGFNTANSSWMFATHFKSDDPNLRDNDGDTSWASQMIIEIGGSKGDCGYAANYGYPLVVDRHLYETIPATDFRKNCFVDFNIDNLTTNAEKLEALAKYSNEPSYILKAGAAATTYGGNVGGLSVKFRPVNGACDQPLATAGAVDVPLMRVEEMKFIEIETTAYLDGLAAGTTALRDFINTYRYTDGSYTARNPVSIPLFLSQLMTQKRIEFWGEGINYFDLKRLRMQVRRSDNTNYEDQFLLDSMEGYVAPWMNFFILEYEYEMNPNIVPNPDTSGCIKATVR